MKNRVVTKMREAKYLLSKGHTIIDIDRNRYDRSRWILIFKYDETLDKDIEEYDKYLKPLI